jgi:soluble lytic murein transglycosylase-like protein
MLNVFADGPAGRLRRPWRQRAARLGLALALLAGAPLAQAELWGFVDQDGVAHFAAEQLDERYELFSRTPSKDGADTGAGVTATLSPNGGLRPEPAAKALAPPRHLAMLDQLPAYKANRKHLQEAAKAHGLDYALLKAVSAAESGFNPQAVSPKGAIGLMQVMPATAERYGIAGDKQRSVAQKLADPRINARTGARYLAYAAYNAGEGAVARYKQQVPPFKETQNYVKTVMQLYAAFRPDGALVADAQPAPGVSGARRQGQRVRMQLGAAARPESRAEARLDTQAARSNPDS